jgi:hypothetical protein
MSYLRIVLAAIVGFAAYLAVERLAFGLVPSLKSELLDFPGVYRPQEGQVSLTTVGMAGIFLAVLVLAALYAQLYETGSGLAEGAQLGALIGAFVIGAFALHNYVSLNIGWRLTVEQAAVYFVEWTVTGCAIGLIYRPALRD